MFVTNHVLAGALIGRALGGHPVASFGVGVISHFLMDSCPHWGMSDEEPFSWEKFYPIARCDGCLGLAAMAVGAGFAPGSSRKAVISGMLGAASVDADKPMLYFFGWNPFPLAVRRLHSRVQRQAPNRMGFEIAVGASLALAVLAGPSRRKRDLRVHPPTRRYVGALVEVLH
ncbi:MAG: hypothetical protein ACP5P1_14325 [Acidimicrobiales bacterium]